MTWFADQNHPLTSFGKNSGLSHPSKLHFRPEVQKKGTCLISAAFNNSMISFDDDDIHEDGHTLPSMKPFTQSYSCRVSKETRSMQRFLKDIRRIMRWIMRRPMHNDS